MDYENISSLRLTNQGISENLLKNPKELVSHMGAMQAQDYNMSKWAIGVRLRGTTDAVVQAAIDKGEILRTHVLRPTWHLVSADDIYWMLELTAPRIKASMKSRHKQLEIDEAVVKKSNKLIERALADGEHLTREELKLELQKGKIETEGDNRLSHLLFLAELDRLICSGVSRGKQQTYALLQDRVPKPKILSKDKALQELARRYFSSHGPATLQDFVWWSGLSSTDAKRGLEMVKSRLISAIIDSQTYWFSDLGKPLAHLSLCLLPAYDEYIISYKDRRASLPAEVNAKAVSVNGLFRPVIVKNGQVIGIWKRTIKKDTLIIEPQFFSETGESANHLVQNASDAYGKFLGLKTSLE